MSLEFSHVPVMLDEVIDSLDIKPNGTYLDGTVGGAGHSFEIASRLETGKLICLDQDEEAIEAATQRLNKFSDKVEIYHRNFSTLGEVVKKGSLDGALLDLGISSHQIDDAERGFSYIKDAPLDMRMNKDVTFSAYDVVNSYSKEKLAEIIRNWGEEKFAGRISSFIVNERELSPIETTLRLADIVRRAIPNWGGESHPEKRTFQAIRIEVNHELDIIEPTVDTLIDCMKPGGRIAIITFHSLEDRAVKQAFAKAVKGCTCPPDIPVCVCGKKPKGKLVTRKPVLPSRRECEINPRAKSAKLRVFEKI